MEYLGLSNLESKKMYFGSMLLKTPSQVEDLCHVRTWRTVGPLSQTSPPFDSYGEAWFEGEEIYVVCLKSSVLLLLQLATSDAFRKPESKEPTGKGLLSPTRTHL